MTSDLSFTKRRWILDRGEPISIDALVAELRAARGIDDARPVATFAAMERAAERVRAGAERGERIGIFGDYDCDGVTATALLVRALRRRGAAPVVRLPHRERDGYGLSNAIMGEMCAAGVTLLLVADTGITARDAVALGNAAGIATILLDHHAPLGPPPDAFAILHPALEPGFAAPHPSAAGIALLFVEALEEGAWEGSDDDRVLAALGTVADLVPLGGVNRALVLDGIAAMARLRDGPLQTLVTRACPSGVVTSGDIAYRIAPRINAAGRMADPLLALEAILEGGDALETLERLNRERQEETERLLRTLDDAAHDDALFVFRVSAAYPVGIIGLIAGKLTERTGRPSLVARVQGDTCTASLRSPPGYDIVEALGRASEHLLTYGGHAQAAGCAFATAKTDVLRAALAADLAARAAPEQLVPSLRIEAPIGMRDVTPAAFREIRALEPFGQGNREPRFLLRDARLGRIRRVGAEGRHLQANIGGVPAIGFGFGAHTGAAEGPVDVACRIGLDTWNGRGGVQLMIDDLRAAVPARVAA